MDLKFNLYEKALLFNGDGINSTIVIFSNFYTRFWFGYWNTYFTNWFHIIFTKPHGGYNLVSGWCCCAKCTNCFIK